MAKFCRKCGAKLDEQTGKCPNCDKINDTPQSNKSIKAAKKAEKKSKKKNSFKKVFIAVIACLLTIILIGTGVVCFLVYKDKLDIPFVNNLFVSLGVKDAEVASTEGKNNVVENSSNEPSTESEDVDLGDNYEVPEFDAEKYFKENTTLKKSFDAASSKNINTEEEAYNSFYERGFSNSPITYEYAIDGTYSAASEVSEYSSNQHPIYQTTYTTANGDMWMVFQINGSFFASPISYNFADQTKAQVIISETNTITSYDSTTNKFYVNVPDKSQLVIKTISKIDAETLEKLNSEEIDKL